MKKPSLFQVTAIMLIVLCLGSIFTNLGALSYGGGLSPTSAKSIISIYILISIAISVCGLIAGAGLFSYRTWSRPLTILITAIFLFQSLPGIISIIISSGRLSILSVQSIFYAAFAIWCLYYFNQADVKARFTKKMSVTIAPKTNDKIATTDRIRTWRAFRYVRTEHE